MTTTRKTIDCTTSTFYTYNPITQPNTATGTWRYFYLTYTGNTDSIVYTIQSLPTNTTVYSTVVAPGGQFASNGGGGGGGAIYEKSIYPISNNYVITIQLKQIGSEGAYYCYNVPGAINIEVPAGSNANHNTGGNGGAQSGFISGTGGNGSPPGNPGYNSGKVNVTFADGTSGSVMSGGDKGLAGNTSWALVYYRTN